MNEIHVLLHVMVRNSTYQIFSTIRKQTDYIVSTESHCNLCLSSSITTNGGSFKWSPCQGLECRGQKNVAVSIHRSIIT